jgi:hypothetical protein
MIFVGQSGCLRRPPPTGLALRTSNRSGSSSASRPGGELITNAGRVTDKREIGGEHLVNLELAATRQTGDVHLKGWATFMLRA